MKKNYYKINRFFSVIILVMLTILPINSMVGQSTIFVDDFGSSHTSLISGGTPLMTYTQINATGSGTPLLESTLATNTAPYLKIIGAASGNTKFCALEILDKKNF